MSRMIASWGVALAVLVCAGLSYGQGKTTEDPVKAAVELLAAKDLHPLAAMYVVRAEDAVKKASDAADARLKEYRHATAREKGALKDLVDLKKERDALKQQIDQTMPNLNAQVQTLNQQQAALRMQINSMPAGGNRNGRMQVNQLQTESNQLSVQINTLQAEGNQLTAMYNELNNEIKQLESRPDTKSDSPTPPTATRSAASSDERKEAYVKAVGELRKQVDLVKPKYAALVDDAEVKAALASLSQRSAKIKYVLGPSKKFLDTVKALESAEAKVASDTILDEPKTADSAKRKSKTAKRK